MLSEITRALLRLKFIKVVRQAERMQRVSIYFFSGPVLLRALVLRRLMESSQCSPGFTKIIKSLDWTAMSEDRLARDDATYSERSLKRRLRCNGIRMVSS